MTHLGLRDQREQPPTVLRGGQPARGRRTKRMLVVLRDWTLPELLPGAMWPAISVEPGKDPGPKAIRAKSSRKKKTIPQGGEIRRS